MRPQDRRAGDHATLARRLGAVGAVALVVVVGVVVAQRREPAGDRSAVTSAVTSTTSAATGHAHPGGPSSSPDPMCGQDSILDVVEDHPPEGGEVRRTADGRWERDYGNPSPHVESSAFPFDAVPTATQQEAADRFVAEVRAAVEAGGWADPEQARAQGFAPQQTCASHWANEEAVFDDEALDPAHPEFLVYVNDGDGGLRLESVMFSATANEAHGPQPFGPVAVWHYHRTSGLCMVEGLLIPDQGSATCPPGQAPYDRTAEMLHVMLDPTMDPFAIGM